MGRTTTYDTGQPFLADPHSATQNNGRQIDWDYVGDTYRSTTFIVKLAAAASVDDTSITVDALPGPLFIGDNLYFGEAKEFVRVTANAAEGATSVTVQAVPTALEDNDEATVGRDGAKVIPAGTVMCALSGGKIVPRAIRPGGETSIGLLASGASSDDKSAALSGYGVIIGGVVYENLLPDAAGGTTISSTYKTELQTAGVGTGFAFVQYADTRGS